MTLWRDLIGNGTEIRYTAPDAVHAVIASLGRTEDVRFAPGNRRVAIAAFNRSRVAVFDIDIARDGTQTSVALTGVLEFGSTALRRPHGLDFLDDETLIVGNREGGVALFKLPAGSAEGHVCELSPIRTMESGDASLLSAPGSVRVVGDSSGQQILICNNVANSVTRHGFADDGAVADGDILLREWLDVPDGVAVSRDRRWIAVSNHNTRSVLLYENVPGLGPSSDPVGMLRGVQYPHGLRFAAGDGHIVLADAGAPYVHVYAGDAGSWRGVRYPVRSFRIMDDALFQRGRNNPQEGGPKGLDIDAGMTVLAVTSECQPLAFFDLPALMAAAQPRTGTDREQQALHLRAELEIAAQSGRALRISRAKTAKAKAKLAALKRSLSWRIAAPLRRVHTVLRRLR